MLEKSFQSSRMISSPLEMRPAVAANGHADSAASTLNLAAIFWRRRWVILASILLCVAVAFVILRRAVPMYQSSCVLYVQQSTPRIISDAVVGKEVANLYTQCELIKSTTNLSAALELPGIADTKILQGSENPVGLLKSLVTAEPAKQGDLLNVGLVSTNPAEGAAVLNGIVQAYIDYQNQQQKSSASEVLKILERQKDHYEQELKINSDAVVQYKQDNPEMALATDHGNIVTETFSTLSDALTHAQFQTLDLQLENDELAALKDDPVQILQYISTVQQQGKGGPPSEQGSARDQLAVLIEQERAAKRTYGSSSSVVAKMDDEITVLQQQAMNQQQETIKNFIAVAAFNLKQAQIREKELTDRVEKERGAAVALNSKSAKFDQIVAEGKRDERMLDTLDNRIKELNVTEDAGGAGGIKVSILETAKPSFVPVSPKPAQMIAIGLIVGVMLGLSGALLQDFMDQRLRSSEEIERLLDLPILGTVPHMVGKITAPERGQETHLRTRSDVAEAYRTIRTAIYFGVPEDSGRTILVTSPAPGDGKSTMASNLAIAMAQAGRHVLLIDADCRRPTQHRTFAVKAEVGLSTVLLGRTPFDEAVHKTSTENLDILPCGPLPTNPSELLDSQAFIDLLKSVAGQYDKVVIDSPPVVPVTDARIMGASCDISVLVLRAEKSTRKMTLHAVDVLGAVGARVLGVVVNDVSRGRDGSYYYSGYGAYRYGYTSHGSTKNGNGSTKEVKAITVTSKALES